MAQEFFFIRKLCSFILVVAWILKDQEYRYYTFIVYNIHNIVHLLNPIDNGSDRDSDLLIMFSLTRFVFIAYRNGYIIIENMFHWKNKKNISSILLMLIITRVIWNIFLDVAEFQVLYFRLRFVADKDFVRPAKLCKIYIVWLINMMFRHLWIVRAYAIVCCFSMALVVEL